MKLVRRTVCLSICTLGLCLPARAWPVAAQGAETAASPDAETAAADAKAKPDEAKPDEAAKKDAAPSQPKLRGLARALDYARRALARLEELDGYTATFVKREMLAGKLSRHEYMELKVRHQPFSVYLKCLGPAMPRGQEVIYVAGHNDGKAWVHPTGVTGALLGDLSLEPDGKLMMEDNRYPLTSIGMKNLVQKLIVSYESHPAPEKFECKVFKAKVDERDCRCVRLYYPAPTREDPQHSTRAYYDKETGLPIRFERFDMPEEPGGEPVLVEEYTYQKPSLDVKLTDDDFDPANPAYGFAAGD